MSVDETFDDFDELREQALKPIDMPNLSLNLLGGGFQVRHIDYIQQKKASQSWKGDNVELTEDILECIKEEPDSVPIFWRYRDLNGQNFDYGRPLEHFDRQLLFKLGYNLNDYKKGDLFPSVGETQIVHSPTISNYWHVEMGIVQIVDKKPLLRRNADSVWREAAFQVILDVITKTAFKDINEAGQNYLINQSDYFN
ncbi:hypothetical protein [Spirosoma daeguense]